MLVATAGGGQTPLLCHVTQNLTGVCPPLHVPLSTNHETHVERPQQETFFLSPLVRTPLSWFPYVWRYKTIL